jgi:pimeloyl-ACP methyl ester carboxylesterase
MTSYVVCWKRSATPLFAALVGIAVVETRVNKVVVMIHGAGDNSNVWAAVGDEVTRSGLEWVPIDLPGRKDETDAHPESIEGLADWAARDITDKGLDGIVLVGHSMGSLVALEVAGRIPDRVRRLVLLCTGTPMVVSDALLEPESAEVLHSRVTRWSHSPNAESNYAEAMERHISEYSALRDDTFVLDLRSCHEYAEAVAAAGRVQAPTTVVLAELDVMVKKNLELPIVEALATCDVVTIEGVGHAIADEAPIETARIIVDVASVP